MGHRATYAIRENGRVELFYSQWGALTVPEDIFWGPVATETFIRENQESDGWLDDVWGEGGVGLNKDEQLLTWYGGEKLGYGPHAELFSELIGALWSEWGWTTRRVEGMPDVAESVGAPRSVALAEPVDPWPVDPEQLGEQWRDPQSKSYFGLVSILDGQTVQTRVLDCGISPFLAAGDGVLGHLDQLPPLDEVREYHQSRPLEDWEAEDQRRAPMTNYLNSGAVIDRDARQVLFFGTAVSAHDLAYFRSEWPGWTVERHDAGLAGHFERAGAEAPDELLEPQWWGDEASAPDAAELTEDELLEEIAEALFGERTDPVEFMRRVTESLQSDEGGEGEVWVNPNAMVSPPESRPSDPEAIFGRALAAMLRRR